MDALPTTILTSPDNKYAFIVLSGYDQVLQYSFDSNDGVLDANANPYLSLANGTTPYYMVFIDATHAALTCVGNNVVIILTLDPSLGRSAPATSTAQGPPPALLPQATSMVMALQTWR